MRIRRLKPDDVSAYRTLMLEAFASDPDAFLSDFAEREKQPPSWWRKRLDPAPDASALVLGAFSDDGALVGIVGAAFETRVKARHKVGVFGLHVDPSARRRGVARALMTALFEAVRRHPHARLLQLTVTEGNEAAITLYRGLGFRRYGTEPMAMRSGERYLAKLHLWRRLDDVG